MRAYVRRLAEVLTIAMATAGAALAVTGASGASVSRVSVRVLWGTVPRLTAVAREVGALNPAARIRIALPLILPSRAAMDRYVDGEYTPGSSDFHAFLTPRQFGQRFGAPAADVARTMKVLDTLSLTPSPAGANRLYVSATGTVGAVERAFGVKLANYRLPTGRSFYANTTNIRLPAALSGLVSGVVGLDSSSMPESQLMRGSDQAAATALARLRAWARIDQPVGQSGGATPCPQAVAGGGYTAPQFADAYNFNGLYAQGFHGEGMNAALVEFDDFHDSNVATMESCYGITTPVTHRLVDGGTGGTPVGGEAEDMADITTLLEMTPALAHLYVYVAPITGGGALLDQGVAEIDLYNAFVTDDKAPVLSSSWGNCEEFQSQAADQLFAVVAEEAAAQGQQIFEAAGDSGVIDCRYTIAPTDGSLSVMQEAATPWVTGVGGTDLPESATTGAAPTRYEDTWNDGGAGGGGQSAVWSMPAWQSAYLSSTADKPMGLVSAAQAQSVCGAVNGDLCRMVPDIAMNADPDAGLLGRESNPQFPNPSDPTDVGSPGFSMYCATPNCAFSSLVGGPAPPAPPPAGAGGWFPIGGTSLATPLAASAAVLWDQAARKAGLGSVGFVNPSLYAIAADKTSYAKDFHDITTDSNDAQYDASDCPSGCNPKGYYAAGTGYDMASGLGSIDAANLGADLIKQASRVQVTPSTVSMYGYLGGPTTTQPVSITSGARGSSFTARSNASWLHLSSTTGTVPTTLSWFVSPKRLSLGTRTGTITVHGADGSTATLTVVYQVTPRATLTVTPGSLKFSENAIDSSGNSVTPTCSNNLDGKSGTLWNDELKDTLPLDNGSDTTPVDPNSRQQLEISNTGPASSVLHWQVFFYSFTSSWLSEDLYPGSKSSNPPGSTGAQTNYQTEPSQPLVPTQGSAAGGSGPHVVYLASFGDANAEGGYPRLDQGTYPGIIEVKDLADPSNVVKVPVTLVLGSGQGTPTIAAEPKSASLTMDAGKTAIVNLALSDASKVCGYAYSLESDEPWATINADLFSGTVSVPAATSAPSASDTGGGNGFTPVTIDTTGMNPGEHVAYITVDSQNAVNNNMVIPITVTIPGLVFTPGRCSRGKPQTFFLHPPHHARVVEALIYVNGRLVKRIRGHALHRIVFARPELRGYALKIVTKLSDGEVWQRTSLQRGCGSSRVRVSQLRQAGRNRKKHRRTRR
jgi:hypothetical protein